MQVTCANCGRSFSVDDARALKVSAARCVCGVRLSLGSERRPSRPGAQALGKYDLLRRIAVGGMGEIFYAKQGGVEGFEREVAIKKMLPHLSEDRNFIDMLIKEAKLTVLLHHPNIVQVYDLAKEGKDYFIAMEYVPGITVGSLLEQASRAGSPLPCEVAVHITMQVLKGLAYAHDLSGPDQQPMNLLHRDITPQNILITRNGWVKITDFGIAKALNEISTTSPGMIKGKLGYIAPEQLAGHNLDQRVDIFCAGIVCWEALATRRLFKGADEVDTFRLIAEAYVPPLAGIRRDVPAALEAALRGALAKNSADRYKTADEFYDALNQAIFPATADDYQNLTKRYFAERPEYFASVREITAEAPLPTTTMTPGQDDKLVDITALTRMPSQPKARAAGLWVVVATVLAALALVGYLLRDRFELRASGTAPSREPAPVEEPGPEPSGGPRVDEGVDKADAGPQPGKKVRAAPPKVLTGAEIQRTVRRSSATLGRCMDSLAGVQSAPSQVNATITIGTSGKVTSVNLEPALPQVAADQCLRAALRSLKFRAHPVEGFQVTIPIKIEVL